MGNEHDGHRKKTGEMAPTALGGNLEDFHPSFAKYQASDALSPLLKTGMDESRLEDNVPVHMITKAHPEGGNTETDTTFWHSLPFNEGLDTLEHALSEILQVSDGLINEEPLPTRDFPSVQATDLYCSEFDTN